MTVIEQIIKDHKHMTRLLDFLDQEVASYREEHEHSPRINLILESLDYLHNYPDAFHHPIESRLMVRLRPRLKRQGDRIQFDLIEDQHQQITAMTQKLHTAFTSVANDQVVPVKLLLSEYALYSELQRDHMELENQHMIPAMQSLLTEEDLAQVEEDLNQMADPLFGAHLWEVYENLYHHITDSEQAATLA